MRTGVVVLATPEVAGLPYVISGLVAAGGMAAAMSTADGLILAIANALSHDVYYNMIDPKADVRKRLIVARVLLVVIGAAGAYIASMRILVSLEQLHGRLTLRCQAYSSHLYLEYGGRELLEKVQ